ncbi:glycosyltransferase [Alkalihalobacillus sp. LMS39]|uniref:glycosyltransferase n=1 Tax=Alkalihalobacillus sp. LMS39 TaxID=2924032 RepID=UPI001FB38793|nr:glycosyltransferase [Alkalihalobacillus sp. LMS39]UOE93871.1 glycosyltransferase [Alkalihalobacillus sp. LMS39]
MKYFMIDNLVFGGAERQASYLIGKELGIDHLLLIENVIKYDLETDTTIGALYPEIISVYKRPLLDYIAIKKLQRIFTPRDTVISFLERSNIMNIKSSLQTKHKSIISVRNYLSERYKSPKYLYRVNLMKRYYPKADLIITNSIFSKNDLVENFNVPEDKIKVIYNLIDTEKVEAQSKEVVAEEHKKLFESPVIINVGSLTPQKAQKQLIESFKNVLSVHPEYKLIIIGSGILEKELIETIKQLKLNKSVYLIGNVKNPFKYVSKSDIFVLNSNFEGFPNVLLEALSVGTPIVAKNCPSGPSEMLDVVEYENERIELTKFGFVIPKRSRADKESYEREKNDLTESICKLIEMKKNKPVKYQALKENSVERSKIFSKNSILEEWKKNVE